MRTFDIVSKSEYVYSSTPSTYHVFPCLFSVKPLIEGFSNPIKLIEGHVTLLALFILILIFRAFRIRSWTWGLRGLAWCYKSRFSRSVSLSPQSILFDTLLGTAAVAEHFQLIGVAAALRISGGNLRRLSWQWHLFILSNKLMLKCPPYLTKTRLYSNSCPQELAAWFLCIAYNKEYREMKRPKLSAAQFNVIEERRRTISALRMPIWLRQHQLPFAALCLADYCPTQVQRYLTT